MVHDARVIVAEVLRYYDVFVATYQLWKLRNYWRTGLVSMKRHCWTVEQIRQFKTSLMTVCG